MGILLKVTGVMAVAIMVQLVVPEVAQAAVEADPEYDLSQLAPAVVVANASSETPASSPMFLSLNQQTTEAYSPPDNGGPQDSQGSGTR